MYQPILTLTSDIVSGISEIAEIKAIVERSRVLPLNEAQLRRQAIIRMVHTSTSIEGNKLAEYQVDRVLSGQNVNADDKSILEVKNHQQALKMFDELAKNNTPLTVELILEVHAILMKGLLEESKTGHFRPGSIYTVDELGDGREVVRFEGPDAKDVDFLMSEFVAWLQDAEVQKIHPVLRAAVAHFQFVNIHPFSDGNGRMARLITTYILYKAKWDFRRILVLDDFYNRDRLDYYNAINYVSGPKYTDQNDLEPWVEFFILGFLVEARKVRDSINQIGFGVKAEESEQVFLDRDEISIMDYATTNGRCTSNDVVEILKIAKRTSQLKLKSLVDKGLLKPNGKGPSTYYTLT